MPSRPVSLGDTNVDGALSCTSLNVRTPSITAGMLAPGAGFTPAQMASAPFRASYAQPQGAAVVAETRDLFVAHRPGTLTFLDVVLTGLVATGADRTVTVDLKKSTGGGAPASVLTAPVVFTNASTLRAVSSGAFSSAAFVAGDIFSLVVTVAGAAGAQAQGLLASLSYSETPT